MFAFIFGRNSALSKAELLTVLESQGKIFNIIDNSESFLILEIEQSDLPKIWSVGGTIRIAEVLGKFDDNSTYLVPSILDGIEVYEDKFNFAINNYAKDEVTYNFLLDSLKLHLKENKFRGIQKSSRLGKNVKPAEYWEMSLDKGLELNLLKGKSNYWVARTVVCTDPHEYVFRDEERPSRVFTHGTSPRTAQQMVNLLGDINGKVVIDPFCGTGTFLIELMLNGADVIGVDIDQELVRSAKQNLNWAKRQFNLSGSYKLLKDDSKVVSGVSADHCIFEPYMGPFLKEVPKLNQALDIVQELEYLYDKVFANLKNILSNESFVVCIIPEIPAKFSGNKQRVLNLSYEVFEKNGFRLCELPGDVKNPMTYKSAKGSILHRKIYKLVLKK